jgi:hypothetical protein
MASRSWLLALLLVASISAVSAKTYLTGKLVRVDSERTMGSSIYVLYIQGGDRSFSVRLVEKPTYKLEWEVNDPIEFRLAKDAIYLKRPGGKEMKLPSLGPARVMLGGPLETPELPFPPTPPSPQQSVQTARAHSAPGSGHARCAQLAAEGAQIDSLANACEYALSSRNLPNFVCQETIQRATRSLSERKWKNLDVVTAEVTFVNGFGDRYLNFAINGHPLMVPPNVDSGPALSKFLIQLHTGGFWNLAEFGVVLGTVFNPISQTAFRLKGEVGLPSEQSTAFDFYLHGANNFQYTLAVGDLRFKPGLAGSIWVDRNSGKLQRIEAYGTELDRSFPAISHLDAINYGDVSIAEVGAFLLPTAAEVVECDRPLDDDSQSSGASLNAVGRCYKNLVSFHDCRKFGAEAHIIPNAADDH